MQLPESPLERCYREQWECSALLAQDYPEQRGLHQALFDWQAEAILRGDGEPTSPLRADGNVV